MWTLDSASNVPLWRPRDSHRLALLAFSTRRGGVSAAPFDSLNLGRSTLDEADCVTENRLRLLAAFGATAELLATAGQVHGARVVEVTAPGHHPECDALVTTVPGLALAVTTADCMSLLYSVAGGVAAAHAGWRGTAAGMPAAALAALCSRSGSSPADVSVHMGPCIRGCCYVVGPEVAARFPAEAVRREADGLRLDLPTAARTALLAAGVPRVPCTIPVPVRRANPTGTSPIGVTPAGPAACGESPPES